MPRETCLKYRWAGIDTFQLVAVGSVGPGFVRSGQLPAGLKLLACLMERKGTWAMGDVALHNVAGSGFTYPWAVEPPATRSVLTTYPAWLPPLYNNGAWSCLAVKPQRGVDRPATSHSYFSYSTTA